MKTRQLSVGKGVLTGVEIQPTKTAWWAGLHHSCDHHVQRSKQTTTQQSWHWQEVLLRVSLGAPDARELRAVVDPTGGHDATL